MKEENLLLIGLTIIVVSFITALGIHNYKETVSIAEGIESGADPLRVSCAYDAVLHCNILAAQQPSTTK